MPARLWPRDCPGMSRLFPLCYAAGPANGRRRATFGTKIAAFRTLLYGRPRGPAELPVTERDGDPDRVQRREAEDRAVRADVLEGESTERGAERHAHGDHRHHRGDRAAPALVRHL